MGRDSDHRTTIAVMKSLSAELQAHQSGPAATLATCWDATRTDTQVFAFTTHVSDLTVDAVLYKSKSAFSATEIGTRSDSSVDNLELAGILSAETITEADMLSGKWDFAKIRVFQVNYLDLSQGKLKQRKGTLGNVSRRGARFVAELRGLMQQLQQPIGEVFQTTCRAKLGDARCAVNLTPFTVTGTIDSINGQVGFTDAARTEAAEYFTAGEFTWTSGSNNGLVAHIRKHAAGGVFTFSQPMPFALAVGDSYSMVAGCRKRLIEDCKTKFNNVVNFRGEPYVPGMDKLLQIGRHG
jgi:uncharacterized phage protein (TIGR02218 family)